MKHIPLLLLAATLLLCGCQRKVDAEPVPVTPESATPSSPAQYTPTVSEEGQLLCLVESQEEAEKVAALYGIELVRYADGLAVYHTNGDPQELIRQGEVQGWPELSLNYTRKPY